MRIKIKVHNTDIQNWISQGVWDDGDIGENRELWLAVR